MWRLYHFFGKLARRFQIGCNKCPHKAGWAPGEGCNCIRIWEIRHDR